MAEKKNWRDYVKTKSTEDSSSEEKTGGWRDYIGGKSSDSDTESGGWRNELLSMVGNNATKRVNRWLRRNNSYLSDSNKRYESRKFNYEDTYVSDSGSWLESSRKRADELEAERQEVLAYIKQNKKYLDPEWVKSVEKALAGESKKHKSIVENATLDNDYWTKFNPNEEQTAAGYTAEKIYNEWQKSEQQYARDMAFDVEAGEQELALLKMGRDAYFAEQEAKRQEALENETWWEKLGRWSSNNPDTSIPLAGASQYVGADGYTNPYDERIAELEARVNRARDVQQYANQKAFFDSYTEMPDFDTKSAYKTTYRGGEQFNSWSGMYTDTGFDDITYDYINKNETARGRMLVNDIATNASFLGLDTSYLQEMTEDEIKLYNYLYEPGHPEAANQYLQFLLSDLNYRRRESEQEYWAAYAKEHPFVASGFSIVTSPLKGLSAVGQVADYAADGTIDQNAGYNKFSYVPTAIRNQVSTEIEKSGKWGKVGSWTYQLGMSMGDFLMTTAVSGGNSTISLALMGSGAMADTVIASKDRGLSDEQALTLGVVAGGAEIITEKLSLDALFKGDLTKGAMKYILTNAFTEGTEEVSSSLINLFADIIVSKDKSQWQMEINDYIEKNPGATESEAFNKVLGDTALSLGLDFLGGSLMGGVMGTGGAGINYVTNAAPYLQKNKDALKQYGDKTDTLIQEGLESDKDTDSYYLAQKYQQQVQGKDGKAGKPLTGYQIRNLLEANQEQITPKDLKKIQQAAEKRLTALGQTKDVQYVAELATKRATGQKLTRAEKTFLANSEYGARVANELLPQNILSGGYSSEWAEEIGTKNVNSLAYNKKAIVRELVEAMSEDPTDYKSLESRMDGEKPAKVSATGKAVIRATGKEIDLSNPKVKTITEDSVVLDVDGKDVDISEIDFSSEEQWNMFNALKKIEHITPAVASSMIAKLDMSKPIWEQLNGMDEAFAYGYYNYSEVDLKAGLFTGKLTKDQLNDAFKLGQYVAERSQTDKAERFKAMRTAAQAEAEKAVAEGKEAPQAKNLTITYNQGGGKVVSIEEAGITDAKQSGAVEVAKILHKMGLGTKVEFFSSYLSETVTVTDKKAGKSKQARVFINDAGVEQIAYSGVYRKADGTIRVDLNAYNGRGLTLNALAHELTHFIQQWSDRKYKVLVDFLMKTYESTDMTMHERVLREQKRLEDIRGEEVSYDEAYDEVVANAMSKMFDDGNLVERLAELKAQDKNLAQKLWEGFKKILAKFIGIYEKEGALFKDAVDLVEMKETFDQLQNMFAEALVDASENYQASLITKEAGLDFVAAEDVSQYSYSSLAEAAGFVAVQNEDGTRSFTRDGKAVSKVAVEDIDNSPIGAFINFSLEMGDINDADAKRQKEMFAKICTMACKTNDFAMTMQFVGSAVFTGMKANADKQYGTTYDFPSICTKTQAVIDAMSAKMMSLGRGLKAEEIVQLYADVFASGNPVPCPECYVFSRWIGIGGLLDNIKKYQDYYGNMAVEDVAAEYRKMKAEVSKFAEEQGISFGKAKGALTSKLTKEFNKLTEKIEKNENQGEKVKQSDRDRLAELEPMMNTVKGMTWLENVYFADSSLKKVNPKFRVPNKVLFDLNNGEAFASQYKEAWAFRTTQGAGYGKAITPYAEARLGEGVLVTNNTTNAIKGKAQGSLNNYFLNQKGKLDKQSRDALKRARLKQKIQAFLGGQRFQSTSDARYENASDYLLAALEMQAMGGMVQCYTKVDGAVPAFSAWGFSINQSLMPLNGGLDADGNVKDTPVGGMKPSVAFENRKNHETAGTITIGVNDRHIREMFKQWVRDFIIPYHASGGKADVVAEFRRIQEGKEAKGKAVRSTDYSRTQSDKILSDEVLRWQGKTDAQIQRIHEIRNARIAILTGGKPNMTVVRSNRFLSALYDKFNGGEWDGVKVAKSKVESQIFPNEFWDQTVTYEESAKITKDYLEYCEDLGFLHRFSGTVPSNGRLVPVNGYNENGERVQLTDLAYKYDENGNKTTEVEEFFWKVLTDRRMYDNSGNYLPQKRVTLNDTTEDTVTGFAKNNQGREYDKAKAEALAQKILKGEQFSMHDTVEETTDLLAFHNITEKLLWDALKQKGLVMPSMAITNKGLDAFGEISLLFDKSVIDPATNKDNKLYGADAWTPMQTSLKMNAKFDTNKTVNAVNAMKKYIGSKYVSELLNITPKQFKEAIIKADGNIYEAYAHNIGVQAAYAMKKGIISQIPTNKDGTVNQEMLQKQLDRTLDTDNGWRQYRRWLNNISDTVITSYDQATNEDILRHMKSQPATAKPFKLTETGELTVPAREYSSIKEMRRNKNRLSEDAEAATKAVAAEFMEFANKIGDTQQVVEAINAGFEGRYNIADIMKSFRNKGIEISTKQAGELQSLYKKAVELPTQYFEAKPGGTVGLDKVNTAVVPENTSTELRQALEEFGINVLEYNGTKTSRVEAMNSVKELRFSSQETDLDMETNSVYDGVKKKTKQEVKANVTREETRESFYRRAHAKKYTVRERGEIAYAYNPVVNQTERARRTEKELQKLGIQVIVHEGLEANVNGVSRVIKGESTSVAGDVVYVRNSMTTDPVETAGHEAYHFWKHTDARIAYKETVVDNVVFYSDDFKQFEKKIEKAYFEEEVGIDDEDDSTVKLTEEIYAYITGLIHVGDSNNIVRPFLRDYDAVKAAWDDLLKKQATHKGQQYSSQETDADNVPTFYSQMGKVVEGMKQDKFGASSVISMLRGRGVKAEEIRWSGIQAFLDGKKSVTKQELLDFINSSMLHIEEEHRGSTDNVQKEFIQAWRNFIDQDLDESEILDGLNYVDTSLSSYLEELVDNEDLDQYYADYILDLAKRAGKHTGKTTKWDEYKLDGGENYRELVFKMPGANYSNNAMRAHWGDDAQGVLAHARIQDFDVDGKKMLFVEEIQSDWHNQGGRVGYGTDLTEDEKKVALEKVRVDFMSSNVGKSIIKKVMQHEAENGTKFANEQAAYDWIELDPTNIGAEYVALYTNWATPERIQAFLDLDEKISKLNQHRVPDAPFKGNYHEYVLKRLLRMAAEEGYDSIGWTTADIQSDRWSSEYAEGYRIEYDQDIPKFLKKYGKQWGTTVGKTTLDNGTEVWCMAITDSMQKSVLKEGQAMYSGHDTDYSNRSLLANAFEGITNGSEEYKLIQEYKGHIAELNSLENKLGELNRQIRKIRFTSGEYDAKKLKELEAEAKNVAEEINRHDRKLVSLEASAPLRRLIEQERKKEALKTIDHVKEIVQNKKLRAEQTELRHKIRKAVRDLDKLLKRGNKKQNVKEDMKGFVSKALELADYLFTDHISNDELIRKGITVRMTPREAALVKETEEIIAKLDANTDINKQDSSLTDEEFTRLDEKRKANEDKLRDLLTAQRNERLNTPVYNLFNDLVTEYANLKNSNQEAVKAAYDPNVERFLRSYIGESDGETDSDRKTLLQNMRVADMTTDELWKLHNAYKMVLHSVRNANALWVKGKTETIEQMAGRIMGDFSKRKIPDKKMATVIRNLSNKMGWSYEKLYYALDRIGSEAFTELVMNIANSENIVMQDVIEAAAFRDEIVKKHGFNSWDVNKEIDREFLDNTGKKFKMTLGQLMALYAYSRREGAWDHIEYGGFVFGEAALTNPKPADSYKLSKKQCEAIIGLLTQEQKGYVEDMQKFLSETMGEKGNEVSMLLYGIKMFGEKNYFPIHIAGQFKAQANESQAKAAAGFGTMSNAGFTHAQNPNAKAPFVLEGFNEIWADHVNEMSRYHGTVPALEDMRRVMNRSFYSESGMESMAIKQLMENSFGKEAVDYFDNLYKEANSGAITDKLQKKSHKLLSLFRKNSVAYSLSVLVQQPASVVRAYAMIDRKYFGIKGVGTITSGVAKAVSDKWTKAHTNAYNEMLKYAPGVTLAKEIGGFDTHTGGSIRSYLLDTNKSLKQKWKTGTALEKGKAVMDLVDDNAIANLPNLADKIAWIEIWNACKRETVAKHKDLATNSDEFLQIVGDRFTEVIRATQVYDSIFAKSPMLKSKNLAVQYLVSFMNEPNTVANMVEKSVRDMSKGDWKGGVKTAAVVIHSIIFTNLLKSIIYAMRDDDEDETYIEKYVEAVAGNMMDDFNALNYIPLARDAWSLAQGYDVERADMAIVADFLDALNRTIKNATTDTDDMTEEQLVEFDKKVTEANWKLVESLASFAGIPVKNVRREVNAVFDHARIASANAGKTTPLSAWNKIRESVIESIPFMSAKESKQDKLYEAIVAGDTAYANRLKAGYKDEDAYNTAVRKALRENDPRIRAAAQAYYDGKLAEYKRIFKEIRNDDKHNLIGFDNIMEAVMSEVSSIKGELEPKTESSAYNATDFVNAVLVGDTDLAETMKEDIISYKVAHGDSREAAEEAFTSSVATSTRNAFDSELLDEAGAEKMLKEYTDIDEEEAAEKVSYWSFIKEHPQYRGVLSQSNVEKYHEFAEPAEIPLDVFVQYIEGTKGIETKYDKWGDVELSVREQVLDAIDSLPISWQQKDALYLAHGYAESKIWDVPW